MSTLKRSKSLKRTVSANQRHMMSVLSQQNCLQLTNPAANVTEKTLDKKKSTVNLMFLEDVLEDIESNAKKMQKDINKNLHNIKYDKEKQKEEESDNDSDSYSDDAREIADDENYDLGSDNDSNEGTEPQHLRMSFEANEKLPNPLQRMDSVQSVRSVQSNASLDQDLNAHPVNSPFKAHSFFVKKKKKACNKAVRLALLEEGPFRQLMKEGVKVIIHFLRKGESRVTRVQRIMIWLDDDEVEQEGVESNVQDREYYVDSSEEEVDFDDDGQDDKLNLFGFFKLDQNGVLESSTSLSDINEISSVYVGANTSVFRRSLDHLHGRHKSYDRSEHSNRCFSLIGCKSPFDGRRCLDIEILPRDKQKPEEIHAACMVAYGIATSFQVLSNLSNNTTVITVREEDGVTDGDADDESPEDRLSRLEADELIKSLFDGGRLPPKRLSVNYLMEEVMENIPNPAVVPRRNSDEGREGP